MKNIPATYPVEKDVRRVPKPLMEKRRRDRINNSLETLRLLLLENTRNENLKNPKVEKAEILESVINFLRAQQEVREDHQPRVCQGELHYREGMNSCLLRVNNFMATKSQQLDETTSESDGSFQTSLGYPSPHSHPASPDQFHRTLTTPPTCDPVALSGQHLPRYQSSPRPLSHSGMGPGLSRPTMRAGVCYDPDTTLLSSKPTMDITYTDTVWRPWP